MGIIIPLRNGDELPATCFVYKHSTTCPVSGDAIREVEAARTEIPAYRIDVREQRELSNSVASALGVEHKSPQLILVREGKVLKVWNHYEIRRKEIELSGATP
jgi:bacillithiol system protein YtxJ